MTVEATLYTTLKADSTFSGLATGGIWPIQVPNDATLPAAAYGIIDMIPIASGSLGRARVQVSCFTSSLPAARSMRDALIDIAESNSWTYSVGPEILDDEGKIYLVPVDFILIEGV